MVRWDVATKTLLIAKRDLGVWLGLRQVSPTPVVRGLTTNYGAEVRKMVLASGTQFKALPEAVLRIKVPPNSEMWDILMTYSELDRSEAAE